MDQCVLVPTIALKCERDTVADRGISWLLTGSALQTSDSLVDATEHTEQIAPRKKHVDIARSKGERAVQIFECFGVLATKNRCLRL
jgi:hypothetical protein